MTPGFAVFILMNNYFHDVATAMLAACAIALRAVIGRIGNSRNPAVIASFTRLAQGIDRVAWFSAAWIILGAVPRVVTFKTFEWANAVKDHHEAGLIVKYAIAFVMAAAGGYSWFRLSRKAREIMKNAGRS